jgi:bifunctional non-homologous end joining protein LigD
MAQPSSISVARRPRVQPMPRSIPPMLAVLSNLPTDVGKYAFEYKWDGVRALTFWDGLKLRILSRNLLDITANYPELQALGRALGRKRAIFDGEIVALDERGLPSFPLLQNRMHVAHPEKSLVKKVPILYMLFDVLFAGPKPTLDLPYTDRREILERLTLKGPCWEISPAHVGEGPNMLESARRTGLEGVVAKRLDSRYEPGRRSPSWLKTKVIFGQEFVIGGWIPQVETLTSRIGSLLLGYYEGEGRQKRLRFAGGVGSGFSEAEHAALVRELTALTRATSPFADPIPKKGALYVDPRLVAEIEYRRWPAGGLVHQAAYKGLRWDKPAQDVVKEEGRHACMPGSGAKQLAGVS